MAAQDALPTVDISKVSLSLIHLMDPDVRANPYPLYRRLRTEDPVHWDPYLHSWVVTRYRDVVTVLTSFSANRTPTAAYFDALGVPEMTPIARVMVKQMLFMDAAAHSRLRRLAGLAFKPSRVRLLRQHIEDVAERLINEVRSRGAGTMDIMADLAEPLPAIVTAELLGVPVGDHAKLKNWSVTFAEMLGNFQHNPDRVGGVLEAVENLVTYFSRAISEQRRRPRPGLIHDLVYAEVEGDRLTEDEVVANCIVTMVGGLETTTNLIGNGMLTLLRNRTQMAELRRSPEILPEAVEELLRYESPSQHTARLAPCDVILGGKQVAKRDAVIAVMAAGNRDPERFSNPDRLDLRRHDNRHLAFGWAAHFCFGAPLARIEGHVAFETLLNGFSDIRITNEPLVWRENFGLRGLERLPVTFELR